MLHPKKNRWLYASAALVTAISINLATPTVSQAGWLNNVLRGVLIWGVQNYQLSNLSDQQEQELGGQIHQELVNSGQITLNNNVEINNYVNEIGQRLAAQGNRPNLKYVFSVVDDDGINAFATMGGRVYVNTGLIKLAENEAELAGVIGHEIAHIEAKHAINQMKAQARNQGLLTAAGLERSQIVQLGVAIAVSYPHSREGEREADNLGFAMLTKAGYAPEAMASFMRKLMAASGGSPPGFLSTHPSTNERVTYLQSQADQYKVTASTAPGSIYQTGLNKDRYRQKIASLL
jgi:beta-barrel assembly-enhancing protease